MLEPARPIAELLKRDRRFQFEAYLFIFESLRYAQEVLGWGSQHSADEPKTTAKRKKSTSPAKPAERDPEQSERHLTGQQLCEAIRLYALEQFGYMSQAVLNHWGVKSTSDIGEIVYNLIEIGQMRKTPDDRREDFDDVFSFEEGFKQKFEITFPDTG